MSPQSSLKPNEVEFLRDLVEWDALHPDPPQAWVLTAQRRDFQITDASGARPPLKVPYHPWETLLVLSQHRLVDFVIGSTDHHDRYGIRVRQEARRYVKRLQRPTPLRWLDQQLENPTKQDIVVGLVLAMGGCAAACVGLHLIEPLVGGLGILSFLPPLP